jgi:integral membrane protein (TIGR00529 family)
MLTTVTGFIISLATILIVSRKNLAAAIICGAIILGLITIPPGLVVDRIIYTITDLSIIILALAMGLIPALGGMMKENGQIDNLINNIRLSRRYMLPFSAMLMGLLPMPGGALLSAPILEKAGQRTANNIKAAINNWFRHLFILIYPLSPALIVATKIADLDIYRAILHLLPGFIFTVLLGYLFFLRKVDSNSNHDRTISRRALYVPLAVILCAPILDFTLKRALSLGSLATLIGVLTALMLSFALGKIKPDPGRILVRSKPWNFSLIIIGMFLYLHIFQETDVKLIIAGLPLPPIFIAIVAGAILAFFTGRVQLPVSIILPVYLGTVGGVTPVIFALIYIAIFFGYIISPVHPCLVVTCEYFGVSIKEMLKKLAAPTAIVMMLVLGLASIIYYGI